MIYQDRQSAAIRLCRSKIVLDWPLFLSEAMLLALFRFVELMLGNN